MSEKEEVAAQVWRRSAAVDEVRLYVTYVYLEYLSSTLTNITLFTEHKNGKMLVMPELQSPKLQRVFEPLPDSVAPALKIM